MSRILPRIVTCPGCGAPCSVRVFESLNGDRVAVQVAAILDGSFETTVCSGCGRAFQPEHPMLYAQPSARLWIVMYPVAARDDFAHLETEIADILARGFAEAPVVVAEGLRSVRPRLVFGHPGLTEAIRSARDAIDPPLLECAKLLVFRQHLGELFPLGPSELVYEQSDEAGRLCFGVRALPTGERMSELWTAGRILGETRARLPEFAHSHGELFERPYVSALRYLYRAA